MAAAEVFTRTEVGYGGSMTSQYGLLTPNGGLTGVLMQNLNLSYAQQVTRIYEIGKAGAGGAGAMTNMYYISGRAAGQINVAHIIGPAGAMTTFYNNFSDVCKAVSNSVQLKLASNFCANSGNQAGAAPASITYTAKYCVLTQLGLAVTAQEFIINESSSMMISGLTIE